MDDDQFDALEALDDQEAEEYDNDDHIDYDDDDDYPEDCEDATVGRQLQRRRGKCKDIATGPKWGCWFRSNPYQAQTRQEKLAQLLDKINGSEIKEPTPFMWTKMPNFFT